MAFKAIHTQFWLSVLLFTLLFKMWSISDSSGPELTRMRKRTIKRRHIQYSLYLKRTFTFAKNTKTKTSQAQPKSEKVT